jgi:hypothetical protein
MGGKTTMRSRLVEEYLKVSKKALRDPRTIQEFAVRKKWDRLHRILWRRYGYMP